MREFIKILYSTENRIVQQFPILIPENLLKDKIEIRKIIRLIDQKTINDAFIKHQLTDKPLDLITKVHINPYRLIDFGQKFKRIKQFNRSNCRT